MNQPGAAFKQRRLGPAQGVYILRLPVQGYVRLLPYEPQAGAGHVQKHRVIAGGPVLGGLGSVPRLTFRLHVEPGEGPFHELHPMGMEFPAGEVYMALRQGPKVGRFAARGCAGVQHLLAPHVAQESADGHGPLALDGDLPLPEQGQGGHGDALAQFETVAVHLAPGIGNGELRRQRLAGEGPLSPYLQGGRFEG